MTWWEEFTKIIEKQRIPMKPGPFAEEIIDILQRYAEYLEEHEPYAVNSINALKGAAEALPNEPEE